MSTAISRIVEGRKFMWDGQVYESREAAAEAERAYTGDGFETRIFEDEGKWLVYTRRVAKVVVVEQPS